MVLWKMGNSIPSKFIVWSFIVVALVGAKNAVWLVRSQRKYAFPKNPNQKRCNENLVVLAKSHVIKNI